MQAANIRRRCNASFAEASPRRIFTHGFRLPILLLTTSLAVTAQTNQANAKLNPPTLTNAASLAPLHGSLTYHLQNTFGRPLIGISVEVRNVKSHSIMASARTGQDGTVSFYNLPPGRYEVTVAGGILPPRREIQFDTTDSHFGVELPLSQPNARGVETVSVQQLTIPRQAREALNAAMEAWQKYDWKKVRQQATRALALHPDYGAALAVLGFLDLQDGKPEVACPELKRAIAFDPNLALAYVTLGSAYNSMKQYDAALEALSVFPSVSADNWQVHYELARSYIGLRSYELGLREIDYSLQLSQHDPAVLHLAKAHVLLGMRKNAEAVPELETVLRTQPNGPYASEAKNLLAAVRSHSQP